MTITESKITNSYETNEYGTVFNFSAQSHGNNKVATLMFDEQFYKGHQYEMEKNILNFIRYSVLGYTDEELNVAEILPSVEEKPTPDRITLEENEVNEIRSQYGEINPVTIARWRESKNQNASVDSENVDDIKNQNNQDFQDIIDEQQNTENQGE